MTQFSRLRREVVDQRDHLRLFFPNATISEAVALVRDSEAELAQERHGAPEHR